MQRAVLDILREEAGRDHHHGVPRKPVGLRRLAKQIAGRDLNPELLNADHSLIESVRRAVKTLERRGVVETGHLWYDTHNPDEKWLAEWQGSGLHAQLTADEWEAVPCRLCTIGPCVGPVGRLLVGSRHPDYACRPDDPVGRLQAALGAGTSPRLRAACGIERL